MGIALNPIPEAVAFCWSTLEAESEFTDIVTEANRIKFKSPATAEAGVQYLMGLSQSSRAPAAQIRLESFGTAIGRTQNGSVFDLSLSISVVSAEQQTDEVYRLAYIIPATFSEWMRSTTPYPNQRTYYKTIGPDGYNAEFVGVPTMRIIPPEELPGERWAWGLAGTLSIRLDFSAANM